MHAWFSLSDNSAVFYPFSPPSPLPDYLSPSNGVCVWEDGFSCGRLLFGVRVPSWIESCLSIQWLADEMGLGRGERGDRGEVPEGDLLHSGAHSRTTDVRYSRT